jgi:hypothetical protein
MGNNRESHILCKTTLIKRPPENLQRINFEVFCRSIIYLSVSYFCFSNLNILLSEISYLETKFLSDKVYLNI